MIYPSYFEHNPLYPNDKDFKVIFKDDASGMGVISYKSFAKGELVAAITGNLTDQILQHTLQIKPGLHLHDIWFSGYFLHSCSPNVRLDMENMLVFAVRKINANDFLYMDYAQTEDVLFKQFPCGCGSKRCRGWITGKREPINEDEPLYREFISVKYAAI